MKDFFKNSWEHFFGMIVLVVLLGLFMHHHVDFKQVKVGVYLFSMFVIENIMGVFIGYGVEVIQKTFNIGTASKKDMYAAMIGANVGWILLLLWVLL